MTAASVPRRPLLRDIVIVVSLKLVVLTVIYALFFAPSGRAPTDPSARLLGPASSSRTR
jgi:hypothetical protein